MPGERDPQGGLRITVRREILMQHDTGPWIGLEILGVQREGGNEDERTQALIRCSVDHGDKRIT